MKSHPKVSIVISCFNQIKYLPKTIESAQRVDYGNLEIVISDDASTDGTEVSIAKYLDDPRIRFFRNPTNLGIVRNYRKGLYDYATGEWAIYLDGDDYLTDVNFIRDAVEAIGKYDDVVLVAGGETALDPDGSSVDQLPTTHPIEFLEGKSFFLKWFGSTGGTAHLGALYRRDLAMKIGFYVHDVVSSDWECLRRLVVTGNVVAFGRSVGVWRRHESNISRAYDVQKRLDNLISITGPYEFAKAYFQDRASLDGWYKEAIIDFLQGNFVYFVTGGFVRRAFTFLSEGLRKFPELKTSTYLRIFRHPAVLLALSANLLGQINYLRLRELKKKLKRFLSRRVD
ncbi:MAG TPA: glycosyltransferase family 2 protein [Candidatus Kryptonia bacterium]